MTDKTKDQPVATKEIRFAPGHDQKPAASFWKVWKEGSEIYALSRNSFGVAKISVHASGKIHYRLGPKLKQDLSPLMRLGLGPWFHAFEIRFLLSPEANAPPEHRELLKNKSAHVIPVPNGLVLYANLLVGTAGIPLNCPVPEELIGGNAVWRTLLRDGRPAVLVIRLLEIDRHNRDYTKYLRDTLKPTITLTGAPGEPKPYIELFHIHWPLNGGNVVMVVPMGDEVVAYEERMAPDESALDLRKFQYQSPSAVIDIVAPNGFRVAVLEIGEVDTEIELVRNRPSTHGVGALKMRLELSNLIAGSSFIASPCILVCGPRISGSSPRVWQYMVFARFDGVALSIELQPNSTSLRNKDLITL